MPKGSRLRLLFPTRKTAHLPVRRFPGKLGHPILSSRTRPGSERRAAAVRSEAVGRTTRPRARHIHVCVYVCHGLLAAIVIRLLISVVIICILSHLYHYHVYFYRFVIRLSLPSSSSSSSSSSSPSLWMAAPPRTRVSRRTAGWRLRPGPAPVCCARWAPSDVCRVSTGVTFDRGYLSACPLEGFTGAHAYIISNWRGVPQGCPQGQTLRALLLRGTSALR